MLSCDSALLLRQDRSISRAIIGRDSGLRLRSVEQGGTYLLALPPKSRLPRPFEGELLGTGRMQNCP